MRLPGFSGRSEDVECPAGDAVYHCSSLVEFSFELRQVPFAIYQLERYRVECDTHDLFVWPQIVLVLLLATGNIGRAQLSANVASRIFSI